MFDFKWKSMCQFGGWKRKKEEVQCNERERIKWKETRKESESISVCERIGEEEYQMERKTKREKERERERTRREGRVHKMRQNERAIDDFIWYKRKLACESFTIDCKMGRFSRPLSETLVSAKKDSILIQATLLSKEAEKECIRMRNQDKQRVKRKLSPIHIGLVSVSTMCIFQWKKKTFTPLWPWWS